MVTHARIDRDGNGASILRFPLRRGSLLILICISLLQSSCGVSMSERNLANLKRVKKGMTKTEVLRIMGAPLRDEVYNTDDVWYYFTESKWSDGMITRDECVPLFFDKQGRLLGWGREEYKRYRQRKW